MPNDSRPATYEHISEVQKKLMHIVHDLIGRAQHHDRSKLMDPEKPVFDIFSDRLRETSYDSPEYKRDLAEMHDALKHHYGKNDHHPEHFVGRVSPLDRDNYPSSRWAQGSFVIPDNAGIHGMNLIQMLEMLADWKAATMRHADGDLESSIHKNAERFGYGEEIRNLLLYTAAYLGWLH